jgi:1,4-dihydroxy-2-naphthoate octaprenyltransferase
MTFSQFADLTELRTKAVSVSSFAIGILFSVHRTGSVEVHLLLLTLFALLAVDMGTTAFNTYFDYMRGVDSANFTREKDKLLLKGEYSPDRVLFLSLLLFGAAFFLGVALIAFRGWPVLVIGGLGMLTGFLYNGGPRPISHTPFGEIFAGGFLGTGVILVTYYIQTGSLPWEAAAASAPSLLLIGSILTVNNTCDIAGDRAAGRKTLSVLLGLRGGEILLFVLGGAGFAAVPALWLLGVFPWPAAAAAGAAAVPAVGEYLRMHRRGFSHHTKSASMGSILKIFLFYTAAVVLGLAVPS